MYFNFVYIWNAYMLYNDGYCQWLFCLDVMFFLFHIVCIELEIWNYLFVYFISVTV